MSEEKKGRFFVVENLKATGIHIQHPSEGRDIVLAGYGAEVVKHEEWKDSVFLEQMLDEGHVTKIPLILADRFADSTGAGDTYMAGYLYLRARTDNLREVGEFAARTASSKLENYGPLRRRQYGLTSP